MFRNTLEQYLVKKTLCKRGLFDILRCVNIKELLQWGSRELIAFDSARLDAELLLSHVLGVDPAYLIAHDEKKPGFFARRRFKKLVARRKKGEPVAYLRGHREFYGLDFQVNEHVLVPRPDTELLVEAALEVIQPGDLLLDVGTGSGCIPISILKRVPELKAMATDISASALEVAKLNAKKHDVFSRMRFFHSNLLKDVDLSMLEWKSLVVTANLPYVPKNYQVNVETKFEPQIALYGGDDGLDVYWRLLEELVPLKPRVILLECYDFQKAILADKIPGYELKKVQSALGEARVLILERKDE